MPTASALSAAALHAPDDPPAKELTVICVAYKRYRNLPVLIHSFLAQTLQNFKLIVIHDGPDDEMAALLAPYRVQYPDVFDYCFTPERHNDYGHTLRDIGIQIADTEYLLITNDDNYYVPKFLEYMFMPIHQQPDASPDIVFCDMVHSHHNPGVRRQLPYNHFETRPERNFIDMGCFIARTALARQVGFRDKGFAGDATYFEDLVVAAQQPRITKIPMALFVHN
jgi:glycosyltransferase involved in cell wall biosynthesis